MWNVIGRQVSLGDPPHFSPYLMDQVFLQDSTLLRRHRTCNEGDTFLATPESPVVPEDKPANYITMTNHGDDCYFYYYSTCTKGDSCPFRHCEAARGNETVCNLWQEGRCFRTVCKFRHMEITKNRKEIPCYWENQPAGCQKPHCAFFHEKPRCIEGTFFPPDKSQIKMEETQHEEAALPPPPLLPSTVNPQLRGVIKTDNQEPVPSPTHPPVVINPADDDEDEDDQFSEEGEEGRMGPSPKKLSKTGESLNFGVSTLEEIRLRKALKASMKKAGYPLQSAETPTNREKENIQSFYPPTLLHSTDVKHVEGLQLKRSLAERLGRVVDEEQPSLPPQKVLKSVKERLGLLTGPSGDSQMEQYNAENNLVSSKASKQICIKGLEEIQQEKAAKSRSLNNVPLAVTSDATTTAPTKTTRVIKRTFTVKGGKTFSEIFQAKKQKLKEGQEQNPKLKKLDQLLEDAPGKSQEEPNSVQSYHKPADVEKVRVKTLEEIRKEKAARLQAEQSKTKVSDSEGNVSKMQRLLHIKKLSTQSNITLQKSVEVTEKPLRTPTSTPETSNSIKVKTFEEIMQEKRLRKRKVEEQVKSSADVESSQNQTVRGTLNKMVPTKTSLTSSKSLLVTYKSPAVSSIQSLDKLSHQADAAEIPETGHGSLDNNQTKSPERPADTKVRPKLNVKPSVMNPVQVKKRGAECSAVAAVKPLSSAAAVQEESLQGPTCRDKRVCPSSKAEAQWIPALTSSPTAMLDSSFGSLPLSEELQTVPIFTPSQSQEPKPASSITAVRELYAVPQSPALKPSTQFKSRRSSTTASRAASTSSADAATSAVEDFDELINQFTGDHLEEDVDPAIGEDDLLQELSEMIDS